MSGTGHECVQDCKIGSVPFQVRVDRSKPVCCAIVLIYRAQEDVWLPVVFTKKDNVLYGRGKSERQRFSGSVMYKVGSRATLVR